ncbi:MAG: hypothetical protein J6B55_02550, partial [Clostridia bacterium]|nr:hypothetical protein [Clostridia bacterium]
MSCLTVSVRQLFDSEEIKLIFFPDFRMKKHCERFNQAYARKKSCFDKTQNAFALHRGKGVFYYLQKLL